MTFTMPRGEEFRHGVLRLQLEVIGPMLENQKQQLIFLQQQYDVDLQSGGNTEEKAREIKNLQQVIGTLTEQYSLIQNECTQQDMHYGSLPHSRSKQGATGHNASLANGNGTYPFDGDRYKRKVNTCNATAVGGVATMTAEDNYVSFNTTHFASDPASFSPGTQIPIRLGSGGESCSVSSGSTSSVHRPHAVGSPDSELDSGVSSNNGSSSANSGDLCWQDCRIVSGTMEALIRQLVPTSTYFPDQSYISAFLLSSRLFIKPHLLLSQVCKSCLLDQNLARVGIRKESLGHLGPNILRLLFCWTELYPYDFRDDRMMKLLRELTHRVVLVYTDLKKEANLLMQHLISRLTQLQKYEQLLQNLDSAPQRSLLNIVRTTDINTLCPNATILAQQLTRIELERFSSIGAEEFVETFAKDSNKILFFDVKKTRNLEAYIQWFNRLSYFVATEICIHLKKKHRARTIEYFIDVAKDCFNIGNFNSFMAIIAGLNMCPVSRLKRTWSKVNDQKLKVLEHHMDPSNNFGSYRSTLKAALWRSEGAKFEREKIVIPFFSLLVKDLYFFNEGCANRLQNGHVNFQKFWELHRKVSEIIAWQRVDCPFSKHEQVLEYVLTCPVFSEKSLSSASFECEAPENNYEKEKFKQLKSKISESL